MKINLQCLGKAILCDRFCPESLSLWRRRHQLTLRADSDLSLPFDDFHAVHMLDIFPLGLNYKVCSSWSWVGWGFYFAQLKDSIVSLTPYCCYLVSQTAFFSFSLHLPPRSQFPLDLLGNLKKSRESRWHWINQDNDRKRAAVPKHRQLCAVLANVFKLSLFRVLEEMFTRNLYIVAIHLWQLFIFQGNQVNKMLLLKHLL